MKVEHNYSASFTVIPFPRGYILRTDCHFMGCDNKLIIEYNV